MRRGRTAVSYYPRARCYRIYITRDIERDTWQLRKSKSDTRNHNMHETGRRSLAAKYRQNLIMRDYNMQMKVQRGRQTAYAMRYSMQNFGIVLEVNADFHVV